MAGVFTVDQVVANTEKIVVSYHFENLTGDPMACFYSNNQLQLTDGSTRMPIGGGAEGNTARIEFAPLPEGVMEASIIASADSLMEGCTGPVEWNVAFALGTTVPDNEILPVVENTDTQIPSELPLDGASVAMTVDRTVELSEGYLLTGHLTAASTEWRNTIIDMETISAKDVNGKDVPVGSSEEDWSDNEFSIKVASKDFTGPLTFTVNGLWVWADTENAPSFSFDAGEDPQVGQSWMLDKELTIAGKTITVMDVQMVADDSHTNVPGTLYGYSIHLLAEGMNNVGFNCSGEKGSDSLFGQVRPLNTNEQMSENYYPDGIPTGLITCSLSDAQFKETGDWHFNWQP